MVKIRTDRFLKNAFIVHCCENNTGFFSGILQEIFAPIDNSYILKEHADGPYGIWTDCNKKNSYATHLKAELLKKTIYFLEEFIITERDLTLDDNERRREIITEIGNQMKRCKVIPTKRVSELKPYLSWSGKTDEFGIIKPNLNDDLVISISMAIHVILMFIQKIFPNVPYEQFSHFL